MIMMEIRLAKTPQVVRLLRALRKHADEGIWLRKLAREAEVSTETASRYVYEYLRPYLQIRELRDIPQRKVVMIRLVREPSLFEGTRIEASC